MKINITKLRTSTSLFSGRHKCEWKGSANSSRSTGFRCIRVFAVLGTRAFQQISTFAKLENENQNPKEKDLYMFD